jgi:hypothetical protein
MDGRVMLTRKGGSEQINIGDFPPGVYSMFVDTGKEIFLSKIIVE